VALSNFIADTLHALLQFLHALHCLRATYRMHSSVKCADCEAHFAYQASRVCRFRHSIEARPQARVLARTIVIRFSLEQVVAKNLPSWQACQHSSFVVFLCYWQRTMSVPSCVPVRTCMLAPVASVSTIFPFRLESHCHGPPVCPPPQPPPRPIRDPRRRQKAVRVCFARTQHAQSDNAKQLLCTERTAQSNMARDSAAGQEEQKRQ